MWSRSSLPLYDVTVLFRPGVSRSLIGRDALLVPNLHPTAFMSCSGEPSPGEGRGTLKSFLSNKQTRSVLSVILVSKLASLTRPWAWVSILSVSPQPSSPLRSFFRSNTARVACVCARSQKNTTVLQSSSERETVFPSSERKFWPISWKDLNSSGTASVSVIAQGLSRSWCKLPPKNIRWPEENPISEDAVFREKNGRVLTLWVRFFFFISFLTPIVYKTHDTYITSL